VLSVSDTGVGIAAEALAKVFEMFAQVPGGPSRPQGGLGIGLSLVQSLVSLHGGSVSATSAGAGQGSTFTVRLPLAQEADVQMALPGAAPEEPAQRLRVLVVDDNHDAAESLGMLLELVGHAAHIAHDGRQALQLAREVRPDVVFLDIGLPDVSGYEVARQLRALPAFEQTMLVALTGWGTEDDRNRTRAAGFDRHLTKPAEMSAVEELLRAAAPSAAAATGTTRA
jgi:CheY-like chemotaxis protein